MNSTTKYRLEKGKIVLVDVIPKCDFCAAPGPFDFKTVMGPWAHGCEEHYEAARFSEELGTGFGQRWVTEDQVAWTAIELAQRAAQKERDARLWAQDAKP